MAALKKRLLDSVGGAALVRLQTSLARKSPTKIESIGIRFGRLFWRFGKRRRRTALSNLRLAFPQWTDDRIETTARAVFEHFGLTALDFLAGRTRKLADLEASMEIVGRERLDAAIAQRKGTLLVTGHFGNWERAAAWLSYSGYPLNVIIRDANQQGVNQVVNSLRTMAGTKVIPRGNAVRPMLECLKANEILGILADQNAEDAFLPFFGRPAGTNLGIGVVQGRTQSVVQTFTCVRTGPNRYRLEFGDWLEPEPGFEVKGEGLLRAYNAWLEGEIRKVPEQWLWFHDRWRGAREAGLL
ncbi:MAG: lysophospholipid acyltransferase family protein [Armatimonadetes bacterium]|nr:lysophospholipid acyltransferase family protein [Armatimonadota bacterium]